MYTCFISSCAALFTLPCMFQMKVCSSELILIVQAQLGAAVQICYQSRELQRALNTFLGRANNRCLSLYQTLSFIPRSM